MDLEILRPIHRQTEVASEEGSGRAIEVSTIALGSEQDGEQSIGEGPLGKGPGIDGAVERRAGRQAAINARRQRHSEASKDEVHRVQPEVAMQSATAGAAAVGGKKGDYRSAECSDRSAAGDSRQKTSGTLRFNSV